MPPATPPDVPGQQAGGRLFVGVHEVDVSGQRPSQVGLALHGQVHGPARPIKLHLVLLQVLAEPDLGEGLGGQGVCAEEQGS